jgi:hypothetical protein
VEGWDRRRGRKRWREAVITPARDSRDGYAAMQEEETRASDTM